jgi:phospholipid/cholesterol/gamma-HCH transport system ATP-binding protein
MASNRSGDADTAHRSARADARATGAATSEPPDVEVRHVSLAFDDKIVLRDVSFTLHAGRTKLILGASGSGKSTILKLILGLLKPDDGEVLVHGERVDRMSEVELLRMRGDLGMVFQEGALFDSLTVGENVGFKLYEDTDLPLDEVRARVEQVLGFVRLDDFVDRRTSELSGGQRRRVAIARAIASKPGILLYDEATTGLDPITAITVDEEIVKLRDLEGVSSIVVTHQLRDAFFVATHEARRDGGGSIQVAPASAEKADEAEFIMLKEGVLAFEGNAAELRASQDPYIRSFLS